MHRPIVTPDLTPEYAPGTHVLLDLFDASHLDDVDALRRILRDAATATGATILDDNFHRFDGRGGVTGVVLLKESHISIHTWPETGFAAVDIFLCGGLSPDPAVAQLKTDLAPSRTTLTRVDRGDA